VKELDRQEQTPAFTGRSTKSMEDAIHSASLGAQEYFKRIGREGKIYLQILRQEVEIGNPHISEYRVFITESSVSG
jgi:hypothetical protein